MSTTHIPPRTIELNDNSYTIGIDISVRTDPGRIAYAVDKANQIEDAIERITGATRPIERTSVVGGFDEYATITIDGNEYQIDVSVYVSNAVGHVKRRADEIVMTIEEIKNARRVRDAVKKLEAST